MKLMMKFILATFLVLALAGFAVGETPAAYFGAVLFVRPLQKILAANKEGLFDWKVGDTLNYTMQIKPLPTMGTMSIKVTADTKEGYTMEEDVNLSIIKQKIEVVIDKNTGEIKRMTTNGKTTAVPSTGSIHLVVEEEAHIKVPAGEFDCIHMVTEDLDHNKGQSWLNPRDLPISGLLKTKEEEGGALELNTELVSFSRGK